MAKRIPARVVQGGVLGVLLLLPARGNVTDAAAVAVALPDEATECRSLLSLCEPAEAAFRKVQEVTRKRECYEHMPKESRTPATLEALSTLA